MKVWIRKKLNHLQFQHIILHFGVCKLTDARTCDNIHNAWEKNGERGKLGQEKLEVGWEVVVFLFNIVNLNV